MDKGVYFHQRCNKAADQDILTQETVVPWQDNINTILDWVFNKGTYIIFECDHTQENNSFAFLLLHNAWKLGHTSALTFCMIPVRTHPNIQQRKSICCFLPETVMEWNPVYECMLRNVNGAITNTTVIFWWILIHKLHIVNILYVCIHIWLKMHVSVSVIFDRNQFYSYSIL